MGKAAIRESIDFGVEMVAKTSGVSSREKRVYFCVLPQHDAPGRFAKVSMTLSSINAMATAVVARATALSHYRPM